MRGLLLLMTTLVLVPAAAAQISPGPLARAHAGLEGAANCTRCHPVGRKDAMDGACLSCHREIAWLLERRRGVHTREGRARCASCHPDHAGREFVLVPWTADSATRFDHRRAGWALEGAHRTTKCTECHRSELRTGEAVARAPGQRAGHWTGLETTCLSCHTDVHRGTVSATCESCHSAERWVPAPAFSHDSTEYPLTGRHRDVTCEACHGARTSAPRPGGSKIDPAFKPLRTAECASCHRDPHGGRLGAACSQCHVTTGFGDPKAGGFDHGKTRYPLRGRHASVRCAACHEAGNKTPAFTTCASCHVDAHAATAPLAAKGSDCAACHDERGFRPSTFSEARHQAGRCATCHTDAHAGQLDARGGAECATCHTVRTWTASSMAPARHAEFRFTLDGKHASAWCGACHGTGDRIVFRLEQLECVSCHVDPHEKREARCVACHTTTAFRPSTVDLAAHARFRFPLEGAHGAVPCAECHQALTRTSGGAALRTAVATIAPLRLDETRTACVDCHTDPHGGQFARGQAKTCDACHDLAGFRPARRFDHQRDTTFPLDGGHQAVPCDRCHAEGTWRGTPGRCEACHR
jgi:hypothetical protein